MRASEPMTTTVQREAFRRMVQQSDKPKTHEVAPYAAPFAKLNTWASRMDPTFIDVVRDTPRVHNEAGVPLWLVMPQPLAHPVTEAFAPNVVARCMAGFVQNGVDLLVGACALGAAFGLLVALRPGHAKQVLRDHALHVIAFCATLIVAGVASGMFSLLAPKP